MDGVQVPGVPPLVARQLIARQLDEKFTMCWESQALEQRSPIQTQRQSLNSATVSQEMSAALVCNMFCEIN